MNHKLDSFTGFGTFCLVALLILSDSNRLSVVLLLLLVALWFAWHTERSASS